MKYLVVADTDIGIRKQTNQDSLLVKYGNSEAGEVLLAVICDGMGGLDKGEVASATAIREFARWFHEDLPYELETLDMQVIGGKWSLLLKELNVKIAEYGKKINSRLGTTFTGILLAGNEYAVVHVGDSRLYHISTTIKQMTKDQTFVAREVSRGTLTAEQARTDKRRNMLQQCVGASAKLEPDIMTGRIEKGVYMLCTDGFRHEISEREMFENLNPDVLRNKDIMQKNVRYLIDQIKLRQEKDNISVILIKAD